VVTGHDVHRTSSWLAACLAAYAASCRTDLYIAMQRPAARAFFRATRAFHLTSSYAAVHNMASTPEEVRLTAATGGICNLPGITPAAAQAVSERLTENHRTHHIFFDQEGRHVFSPILSLSPLTLRCN
jgi:hypothetical protein